MSDKIPGFFFNEDLSVPEANSAWRLEDINDFAQYLKDNIDPGTKVEFVYIEFTPDQWRACELRGKLFDGQDLTIEEEEFLQKQEEEEWKDSRP